MTEQRAVDASPAAGEATTSRSSNQLPSGRHGLPREFVIRNQQMRIIEGIATAVASQGYAATTVADILEHSGVSRRTFYEHYRSKEDCFLKAFDAIADGLVRRVTAVYTEPGSWPERVVRALAAFLDILQREPVLARMCMVESLAAGPEAVARYGRTIARFEAFFEDAAERSPHRDRLPQQLSWAVVGGIVGVVYRALAGGEEYLPDLLPKLVYFALAPYLGPDVALEAAGTSATAPAR